MPDFSREFISSKGQPIVYKGKTLCLMDRIPISKTQSVRVVIEEINSNTRQGLVLDIFRGNIIYNGVEYKRKSKNGICIDFWADEATFQTLTFKNTNRVLNVWNFWEQETCIGSGKMKNAWTYGAAMIVEELPNGRRYRCNDWEPDEDFDDLIFRIELLD